MSSLVRGQNLVWPGDRLLIEVTGGPACDVSALLLGADEKVRSSDDFIFYNQPAATGVSWIGGPPQRIEVQFERLQADRLICVLSLDPHLPPFGQTPPPQLRLTGSGIEAHFAPAGLTTERALVAVEVYRRNGEWKVRAVGQGYPGGLAELVTVYGVEVEEQSGQSTPPTQQRASVGQSGTSGLIGSTGQVESGQVGPAGSGPGQVESGRADGIGPVGTGPVGTGQVGTGQVGTGPAGDGGSWHSLGPPGQPPPPPVTPPIDPVRELEEQQRLFRISSAILEDASRSTASLQSTRTFAERQLHAELERMLEDPRLRTGDAADQARRAAQHQHDQLISAAQANHHRDIAQLTAELAQWRTELPPSMADWGLWPARWRFPQVPSLAVKVGDLTLADAPDLHIPYLLRVPAGRPMVIDPRVGGPDAAAAMLRSLLTRLLAGYPSGGVVLHVIDPAGRPAPFAPLGFAGCAVQSGPAATTLEQLTDVLISLAAHADRYAMAAEAGMLNEIDRRDRLVVVTDFPTGFDDKSLMMLRHLLDVGPRAGVQFLMVSGEDDGVGEGDFSMAATILRACNRLPAGPGGVLTDSHGGVDWTFLPDLGPDDPTVLDQLLSLISRGQ